ncbi:hypothetical protein PG996_003110 [Apiospora saccharicola]|uniref:Carrier domain-containing protein n=1 Tax=Apiospora saccharicola TaxID=335842 RepID=A0ABR1W389_9PEZI
MVLCIGQGQANYAAGGTYQTALARYRRTKNLPAVTIDVGKISRVGFVAENAGTVSDTNLKPMGWIDITDPELLSILDTAISTGHSSDDESGQVVTGILDIELLSGQTELPTWTRNPILSHLDYARPRGIIRTEHSDKGPTARAAATTAKTPPLRELLKQHLDAGQEAAGLRDDVLGALTARLARALMIPASEVDTLESTSSLGADSLVAVEVRNWLLREGGVAFPVFEILQAPSVVALAGKIADAARAKYMESKK